MARPSALLLALLLVAPWAGAQSQEDSIGVSPGAVEVRAAQPGQTYHASVSVQNQYDSATTFTIDRAGAAGAWTVTDPAGPFTVPARSAQRVALAITPPEATGPGNRTGELRFTTETKGTPTDSGAGLRLSVTVLLAVEVGGAPRTSLQWLNATAANVRAGEALRAWAGVRNDGNVRSAATVRATATAIAGGPVLAEGEGSASPDPGEAAVAAIALAPALPAGQYLLRVESVEPPGFSATLEAKVVPEGTAAPDGRLRAILNPPRVAGGEPVTFLGWFESTGTVPVASARLFLQVLRGEAVVATLAGDAAQVAPGASVNLTAVWTPAQAGAYRVVGHVQYDAYRTPDVEGRIEVLGAGAGVPWLLLCLALLACLGALLLLWWRRLLSRRGQ